MESLLEVWRGAICLQKAGPLLERGDPLCYWGGSAHPLLPVLRGDPGGLELWLSLSSAGSEKLGTGRYFSPCPPRLLCGFPHPLGDGQQHWDVGQESS